MFLKLLHLRTVATLVDKALDITDMIDEPVIGVHLSTALHVTEQRIDELEGPSQ